MVMLMVTVMVTVTATAMVTLHLPNSVLPCSHHPSNPGLDSVESYNLQ
jgi:hypothetical protein